MIRTQIYLPEDLKLQLVAYAQMEEVPISEIIRRSVRKEIKRRTKINAGAMLLKFASTAKKGPKDLSSNFFEYAYGKKSSYAK